jgi:NitT/TauT family transport system substrate-binding protein
MRRSSLALPLLIKGELDVMGGTNSYSIYNAMAQGAAIKIVASRGINLDSECPYNATMVRKDLGFSIKTLTTENIRGRRVGINPKSSTAFLFDRFLERYGLSLTDMQIVDIPNTLKAEAFSNGAIDFSRAGEPWVTRLAQAGSAEVLLPDLDLFPEYDQGFVLYGERLLVKDRNLGIRFMKAYMKALATLEEGKTARNIEIISKHTKLDSDFLNLACWPGMRPGSGINIESVLEFLQWGVGEGHLDRVLEPEKFWDPSFIMKAAEK